MKKATSAKEKRERLKRNEEKWTPALMEAGWTVIPSVILERQKALGLDPIDLNILMQLAQYWWYKDNPPHPSKRAIAECIGRSPSTVQKRIARMERDGLIERVKRFDRKYGGQTTNQYLFTGLIESATPFAEESIQAKKQAKKDRSDRRTRKKPKLRVIKNKDPK
jgi:DNA-binding transcriptional regulator YhcF (GntR family)